MFRIRHKETPRGAPAVLLQHGLMDTADAWIMDHPDESPAFVLAREGYDVWLGNNRGNRYSRKHETMSPTDEAFWDFSWQEMADHDLPALINFVLDQTSLSKISYIGHSQGNTQLFYALSQPNTYQDKLNLFVALSPLTKLENTRSKLLLHLDDYYDWIVWYLKKKEVHEAFGYWWNVLFKIVCGTDLNFCTWTEGYFVTQHPDFDDADRF